MVNSNPEVYASSRQLQPPMGGFAVTRFIIVNTKNG
jgi:hypothetical protein